MKQSNASDDDQNDDTENDPSPEDEMETISSSTGSNEKAPLIGDHENCPCGFTMKSTKWIPLCRTKLRVCLIVSVSIFPINTQIDT